jgi:phosphatidylglycerophosphate synthase
MALQPTLPDKMEHKFFLKEEGLPKRKRSKTHSAVHAPSVVTAVRLSLVPLLVFLVSSGILFYGAVLFLLLLCTDFLDGYIARRFGLSSKFGTYFDVTTDFIFVFCMFLVFNSKGFVPDWVLFLITLVFVQFVITSFYSDKIYDPVGKYYGSLLYGAIGLRFILSGQFFYVIATVGITGFGVASILSRAVFFVKAVRGRATSQSLGVKGLE